MPTPPLSRALRAALAVTIVGTSCADATAESDTGSEVAEDTISGDGTSAGSDTLDPSGSDATAASDGSSADTLTGEDIAADLAEDDVALEPEDVTVDSDPEPEDSASTDTSPEPDADAAEPDDDVDAAADTTGPDTSPDEHDVTVADVSDGSGTEPETFCKDETDEVCPERCTVDNDFDCCMAQNEGGFMFCTYFTGGGGCGCAVEGPFAPPSTRQRPVDRRLSVA